MANFFYGLVIVMAFAFAGVQSEESIDLGDSDFVSTLETMDTALVMFYAPWCGHCKRLKPEFEKAAGILKANDPPVHLAKVDCTEAGKDTCGRFEVSGYPTLKIFRGGELSQDYGGPREAAGIVKFMKAQVGAASKECKTDADVEALLKKNEVVVISYLTEKSDQDIFGKVANVLRESVAFGHAASSTKGKGIVLYRPTILQSKFEDKEVIYDGKIDKDDITKWVKENYHGLVGHRTLDNAKDFKEPLVIVYFGVDYAKNVKGTNYWRNRVMKVAKGFEGRLNFAVCNEDDFQAEATEFGINTYQTEKPLVAIKSAKGKFVMSDEFTPEAFEAFLKAFEAGSLEPYFKSEAVPEPNDGPVKIAVAKNFQSLVADSKKDVLIEFYAPWCGHCKKLTPIYDELGQKMAGEEVEIVKMDATANDVPPGYDVRGFPTLFWLPKNTKTPVAYQGGRELDDFVKFIAEKATDELNTYDRSGKQKKSEL
jgi:protein disulfide isomerase family A protein 3